MNWGERIDWLRSDTVLMRPSRIPVPAWQIFLGLASLAAASSSWSQAIDSAVQRINEAIPLTEPLLKARAALENSFGGESLLPQEVRQDWQARLVIRAQQCGKGYAPGLLESTERIRQSIGDRSCFLRQDESTLAWINNLRVARLLALPPLRAVPTVPPRFIVSREAPATFRFANRAGVSLVTSNRRLQIIDIASSDVIFEESRGAQTYGLSLSDNGRVFTDYDPAGMYIRDAETGETLVRYPDYVTLMLMGRYAFAVTRAEAATILIEDFDGNQEVAIPGIRGSLTAAIPVPGHPNQVVIATQSTFQTVEISRSNGSLRAQLVVAGSVPQSDALGWNTGDYHPNGDYFANGSFELSIVRLGTLRSTQMRIEPFSPSMAILTPNPDEVIISGAIKGMPSSPRYYVVVNIRTMTGAVVDKRSMGESQIVYVHPLNKLGLAGANGRVEIIDSLQTLPARSFDQLSKDFQNQLSAALLAPAARLGSNGEFVPVAPGGPNAMLSSLVKGAEMNAVGVYRGDSGLSRPGSSSQTGDVTVTVKKSSKPIVLILASYDAVHWHLNVQKGARIPLLLLCSYSPSDVSGAEVGRTIVMGQHYAYQLNSPEYALFERDIFNATGRHIDYFQGSYTGSAFTVGDNGQ